MFRFCSPPFTASRPAPWPHFCCIGAISIGFGVGQRSRLYPIRNLSPIASTNVRSDVANSS